jgi:hypothetical protein
MKTLDRVCVGLEFLSGVLIAIRVASVAVFSFHNLRIAFREHIALPFWVWVGCALILFGLCASLSLLMGTVAAMAGRIGDGSRCFILGSIYFWLSYVAALWLMWIYQPSASRSVRNILSDSMSMFIFATYISIVTFKFYRSVRNTESRSLNPVT